MTTLTDRPNTALLVVDLQRGVVDHAHERDRVVANAAVLVQRARQAGVPVVWVQHSSAELPAGSEAWQYVPELVPAEAEPIVAKTYADAFEETELEAVLADRRVGRLLLAGAQTDECIRSTLHGAIVRGYDITLVGDAHTTEDLTEYGAPPPAQVIAHTNLYWQYHRAPGRTAAVVPTADVQFATGDVG
ncbi:MAG TPA: isochorismatase family protein [Candidatus Nanopelagicales bacterium]